MIQTLLPEGIVTVYDASSPDAVLIEAAVDRADAVVCGCGLGVSRESLFVLSRVLRRVSVPLVLDADALNLLSQSRALLKYARGAVITPHPMEMSRLTGLSVEAINADRATVCHELAAKYSLVCVLKGHNTVVSDGDQVYINTTGNSGMATAGSGDVLAGIVGGLLSQSRNGDLSTLEVAALSVYIHGLCGDVAAEELSEYSVMATDIINALPCVLKRATVVEADSNKV